MICGLVWVCSCMPWLHEFNFHTSSGPNSMKLGVLLIECVLFKLEFMGINWAILVLVWLWSFCLLQCDSKVHSLTCFVYEMDLVHSFDVRPIGFYFCLINLDFDQFSLAVLNFSPPFDPRLVLVVLFLMFEFAFQCRKQML